MRKKAWEQLEKQLGRLAQQQNKTKQKLRALTRQAHLEQRYRHGKYVELAGLAHLDPGTLVGGLCELAALLTDPERSARWKELGDVHLAAHRRRKAHRRHPASSVDGDTSNAETEATLA
jgi:conjugative transfer protein TraD